MLRLFCWKGVYLPFRHAEKGEVAMLQTNSLLLAPAGTKPKFKDHRLWLNILLPERNRFLLAKMD